MKTLSLTATLLILISSLNSFGAQSTTKAPISVETKSWTIQIQRGIFDEGDHIDHVIVHPKDQSTTLFDYAANDTGFFITAKEITLAGYANPLLVTEWSEGANTVGIKVFDPELRDGKVLFETNSVSFIDYHVLDDHLEIEENSEDPSNDNMLVTTTNIWKPEPLPEKPEEKPSKKGSKKKSSKKIDKKESK